MRIHVYRQGQIGVRRVLKKNKELDNNNNNPKCVIMYALYAELRWTTANLCTSLARERYFTI